MSRAMTCDGTDDPMHAPALIRHMTYWWQTRSALWCAHFQHSFARAPSLAKWNNRQVLHKLCYSPNQLWMKPFSRTSLNYRAHCAVHRSLPMSSRLHLVSCNQQTSDSTKGNIWTDIGTKVRETINHLSIGACCCQLVEIWYASHFHCGTLCNFCRVDVKVLLRKFDSITRVPGVPLAPIGEVASRVAFVISLQNDNRFPLCIQGKLIKFAPTPLLALGLGTLKICYKWKSWDL